MKGFQRDDKLSSDNAYLVNVARLAMDWLLRDMRC